MENDPFVDDFPIKTSIYKGFSMAMLNNQRVYQKILPNRQIPGENRPSPACALARSASATSCANSPRVCCSSCCSRSTLGSSGSSARDSCGGETPMAHVVRRFTIFSGKTIGNPEHHGKMRIYPLVNIQKTDGKITMLLMGKSTISMTIFNSYVTLPRRVKLVTVQFANCSSLPELKSRTVNSPISKIPIKNPHVWYNHLLDNHCSNDW